MSESGKAKLAKGAAKIREAETEAATSKPIGDKALTPTRDIKAVLKDRVKFLPGHTGLTLDDDTSLAECLQVLEWAVALGNHIQFLIGDVINFGFVKWGNKYQQAMEQTGRAVNTLAHYASVARRIPARQRKAVLSFAHHREIVIIGDDAKIEDLLNEAATQAENGKPPSVIELRRIVQQLTAGSGKQAKVESKTGLSPRYHSEAVEELVSKGIASGENAARRLLTELEEQTDVAPVPVVEPAQEDEAPQGWPPPVLEESDLTEAELAALRPLREHLASKPTGRCQVFLRYIRESLECEPQPSERLSDG